MIAVDTSALIAIILDEPAADACIAAIAAEGDLQLSAGTLAEVLIVAARHGLADEAEKLIDSLGFDIVNVTPAAARRVAAAYDLWGMGVNPAGLNFGDCFAYEVAKENGCRLLYVGADFANTDLIGVL